MSESTHPTNNAPDEAQVYAYHNVEASLRQATSLVEYIRSRLLARRSTFSAAEKAILNAHLEELVLLVGALQWQIQEQ